MTRSDRYVLVGSNGLAYRSPTPGTFGGHRRSKIYGRLDCPSALRHLVAGHYAAHRVFFADEPTAVTAGYRPCAVCLPEAYAQWKAEHPPPVRRRQRARVHEPGDGRATSVTRGRRSRL